MILLSLALLGAPPVGDEPAAAHPADAAILVQMPDVAALLQAYTTTAYGRLLADPALHESIGQALGAGAPVDPRAMLGEQWKAAQAEGAPPVDQFVDALAAVSFSLSVPNGDLGAFLAGLESVQDPEARMAAQATLRLVLDFKDAAGATATLAALRQALEQQGAAFEAAELPALGGVFGAEPAVRVKLASDEGAFGNTFRVIAGGTRVVALAGAESDEDALARMTGKATGATGAATLATARQGFEPPTGVVGLEVHLAPFVEAMLLAQEPMALPMLDLAEGLLGPLASMAIRGGDWRIRIDGGQFVTEGNYPKPAATPLAGLFGAKPLAAEDLALVMPDATLAWAVSMDKEVLQRLLAGAIAQQGGEEMLVELENAFGFRPDRDLIAPLGDSLAYSLSPITSFLSAPPFSLSLEVADLATFTKGMDGVFNLLEAQAADALQVKREEYKGVRLYTISFAGADDPNGPFAGMPINPASMFRPTIAIGQGRAFVITTPNLAKKEVRRVDKLAGQLEVHPALAGTSLPAGACEVGYADWADFIDRIYSGAKGIAPMLADLTGQQLPFDLAALPEAEVITKHFQPSRRSKRLDGERVRVHARSSFGPEAVLALAGAGTVGTMRVAEPMVIDVAGEEPVIEDYEVSDHNEMGAEEVVEAEPYTGPDAELMLTQDTLLTLKVDLTLHRFDHGAFPATLADLGKPAPNDGWGRALVYKVTQAGFTLYSLGPNGVDDGGAGDDILAQQ